MTIPALRCGLAVWIVLSGPAMAQQQASPMPFTEWRAELDSELSKLAMPRDAHTAIFMILQAQERKAQYDKMQQAKREPEK